LPMQQLMSEYADYIGKPLQAPSPASQEADNVIDLSSAPLPSSESSAAVVAPTAGQGVGAQQTAPAAPTSNTTIRNNPALLGSNPINVLKNMIIGQRNP